MQRVFAEATTIGDLVDRAAADLRRRRDRLPRRARHAIRSLRPQRPVRALAARAGREAGRQGRNPDAQSARLRVRLSSAAAKLGAVPVPVNGRFKAHELGHVIAHADITRAADRRGAGRPRSTTRRSSPRSFPTRRCRIRSRSGWSRRRCCAQLVHLNGERPGFLSRTAFDAAARGASARTRCRALQQRVADPRRRDADVHVGHDRQAQGLPAQPRGARPPRRQRAPRRAS